MRVLGLRKKQKDKWVKKSPSQLLLKIGGQKKKRQAENDWKLLTRTCEGLGRK